MARAANQADAEDALQDAFVAAFRFLPSYRSRYQFSTWLFTIAMRQLGRVSRQYSNVTESADAIVCDRPGPEQMGIQSQHRESIWQAARDCLSDIQFTTLWLFYVEDMPLVEIGKAVKRPVSWVKVNLMRARRRLSRSNFAHVVPQGEVTS